MTSRNWIHRLSQSSARQDRKKTDLLPLPVGIRNVLSLEYHLLLETLRAGAGTLSALKILTRVALATSMLDEHGYGGRFNLTFDVLEDAAYRSFKRGELIGTFSFEEETFCLFAELLTHHDRQLAAAPVSAIERVGKRLEHPNHAIAARTVQSR
ncbi:Fis family transcriptional regulator [Caballeronia sp. dw_19]|uniref:Fis family transcriptional regulator n=1 Tax=Caballeronia sp. dw_19 TaxID=2719791 RepID=UPI001BD319DA|nr:Fis family transcriptional regulator [Caballeronia sp. dw_19]